MLDSLENVTFPRSIKPINADPNIQPSLVTFSDGNENAYGCVAYALWTLVDGTREARLIMSKAKLGPLLQKGEVVKNELSGATFAARLKTWIIQNTGIKYDQYYPFLDSRIVQDMLQKSSYLLNTFAGLRVKEIDCKTDVSSWLHISSKDNWVADILTRGASPEKLKEGSDWQTGPSWLVDDPNTWPITVRELSKDERVVIRSFEKVSKSKLSLVVSQSQGELHYGPLCEGGGLGELHMGPRIGVGGQGELHMGPCQVVTMLSKSGELHSGPRHDEIDDLILRCSSLNKIINTVAFMLRLGGRNHSKLNSKGPINAQEHDDALKTLIFHEQRNFDVKKYSGFDLILKDFKLNSGKTLKLWTLNSRIQNFPIQFDGQNNFVFPLPNSTFAKRIATHFHKRFHRDVDTIVAKIRAEFWIPYLRRIVTEVDKNCKFCAILRKKISNQLMGTLPSFRSQPSKAFDCVSADLFGPIMIRDSVVKRGPRVKKKVWGILFVCCSTRAVYLDIAEDYSTESILHCVRRLMADHGQVSRIISDPGTQLKGADRELREARDGWDKAELVRFGAKTGVQWDFTMPASPHQNGAVEVMIKMVKGVMKALTEAIGTTVLFMNELFTLMKEVTNLVNSRPIGLKPNQTSDPHYLSPNSLLLGRASDTINSGPFMKKDLFDADPNSDRTRFLLVQKITNQFWKVWTKIYFPTLLRRQKWHVKERNLVCGDVCMLRDSNAMRGEWRMCLVKDVFPDNDGVVRNVVVTVPPPSLDGSPNYNGGLAMIDLKRHVSNLIVIVPQDEIGHGEDCKDDDTEHGKLTQPMKQADNFHNN